MKPKLVVWYKTKIKTMSLASRTNKNNRQKTQMTKIRNETGPPLLTLETKRNVREYCEQLYANKLDNLHEMKNFLENTVY